MATDPETLYRQAFSQRLLALQPQSLLDLGCGGGERLRMAMDAGIAQLAGIDPNAERIAEARALCGEQVALTQGSGERLPLADRSVDVVTLEFVAHHLADLRLALQEAVRVARIAVLVMDGWYDLGFASQRVACDLDRWSKAIDRRGGMVHHALARSDELAGPFMALGGFEIEIGCHLMLRPWPDDELRAHVAAKLAAAGGDAQAAADAQALLARAASEGISQDGAVILCATRR